jgi:GWxTD domain-containing protein
LKRLKKPLHARWQPVGRSNALAGKWVISIWFAGVILLWSRLNIGLIVAWRMKSLAIRPATTELQLVFHKLSRRLGVVRTIKLVNSAVVAMGLRIGAVAHAQSTTSAHRATESSNSSQELPSKYQRWLDEDVRWIITPEERAAFIKLPDNEERDQFVKGFWDRRNPTPGTAENKFKEEYYRRIAYANAHFAASIPGWKTDRGPIYIMYGPPDEIDSYPLGGDNSAKPKEIWRYRYIQEYAPPKQVIVEGKTELKAQTIDRLNVDMKFVDVCSCGDYRLQSPPKK